MDETLAAFPAVQAKMPNPPQASTLVRPSLDPAWREVIIEGASLERVQFTMLH